MRKLSLLLTFTLFSCFAAAAQDNNAEDIVYAIDELRLQWDDEAVHLESFEGMEKYCHEKSYRKKIAKLLNRIHHYDTLLYLMITEKYDSEKDAEAGEALKDILMVETAYSTPALLAFLRQECEKVKTVEKHQRKANSDVESEIEDIEKELTRYIEAVTLRIDLVDEHVHHLKKL